MIEALVSAVQILLQPAALFALLVAAVGGMVMGALPGLGLSGLIVLLGFVHILDPHIGILIAIGLLVPVATMDAIPAVLFGVPGSVSGQALIMDGPPLARAGKAGEALGANYAASLLGGMFGVLVLAVMIPISRPLVSALGSPEYLFMALLGIALVAVVSKGSVVRGLLAGVGGLTVGLVGLDPTLGNERLTFGQPYLYDGIGVIALVLGLFAVPEIAILVMNDRRIARGKGADVISRQAMWRGIRFTFRNKALVLRSSGIGAIVGMMPGVGGSVVDWLVYAQAKYTVPGGRESFGRGDLRGIVAPGSADNSMTAGSLVPTLAFGIPGSVIMAVLIAFLILLGFRPGPQMMQDDLDVVYLMVLAVGVANLFTTGMALLFTPQFARITLLRPNVLAGPVLGVVLLVSYDSTILDMATVLAVGILGIGMRVWGWPRPPLLIAFVLAPIIDNYGRRTLSAYGADVLVRPQVWTLVGLITLITLLYGWYQRMLRRRETADVSGEGSPLGG